MITVDQALAQILESTNPLGAVSLDLADCLGRRLAQPVVAREGQPSFASSAMDGYALGPARGDAYLVVAEVAAGQTPERPLGAGECARIFTGAPLPEGCWAVVPQEDCQRQGDSVQLTAACEAGQHLRPAGEHCRQGDELLPEGRVLSPADLGLAALLGYPQLVCRPRPRVAILATGDELVELDQPLGPAQVRNSNAYALQAQIRACGAESWRHPIVPDRPEAVREAVLQCLRDYDLVVTCGGASVGDRDYVQSVLQDLGAELRLWRVAMRPGKPLGFALCQGKPVVALPGNPVSSFVTFELFVRPLLDFLQGGPGQGLRRVEMTLGEDVQKKTGLRFFIRCRQTPQGVVPSGSQGSHLFRSVSDSLGLLELPERLSGLQAGASAQVLLWPWEQIPG